MSAAKMEFDISIGRNRYETRWKNERWSWERLREKLETTVRTPESAKDYAQASRQRRGEIKDIGGFVGGFIQGGHRKKGAVTHRQLLTLDIDYATGDTRDDIDLGADFAYVLYSTHSHTREKPRFRLIAPMSRECSAEEYEAVGRKIAARFGIDAFDDTTYEAERLMYWPSTSVDGEYVCQTGGGDAIDVDAVLAEYRDWRDVSQWEISSRISKLVAKAMKKQADPLDKPGAVGRFCRAYTIQEAIAEFLPEIYTPTTQGDRYTYAEGSTAGGLVIYDDKFAFSHHSTDPCSGQLCNAFDLVRIHNFGLLDEEAKEDTPVNRMPSYVEMEHLVTADTKVRLARAEETQKRLSQEFGHVAAFFDEGSDGAGDNVEKRQRAKEAGKWRTELEVDKKGNYTSSAQNIIAILENENGLAGNIMRNDLIHADVIGRDLPWRSINEGTKERWSDDDDVALMVMLETVYGITGQQKILNVRQTIATRHRFHPVRDYLDGLEWDGEPRVERLFIDCLGAPDTKLTREVTRKAMAAAVARVYTPGCKWDYIVVLQGVEGIGKSTILRYLGGEWFTDSITNLDGKEGKEQIQGYWIEELGELVGVKRSEVESIKAFLSCQTDSYRPAYGRIRVEYPRQCVFFATTNEGEFLKGDTGNRRFWVLPCGQMERRLDPFSLTQEYRDQLWAEAREIFKAGERLYLDLREEDEMRLVQSQFNEDVNDARVGMIAEYLEKELPADWKAMGIPARMVYLADAEEQEKRGVWKRERVCAAEVLAELFGERIDDRNRYKAKEINGLIARIPGWRKAGAPMRFPAPYGLQRGFMRDAEAIEDEEL